MDDTFIPINPEVEKTLSEIRQGYQSADLTWLSNKCVELSGLLYYHSSLTADAELRELTNFISNRKQPGPDGKTATVADAEAMAVVNTQNKYGKLKLTREAIQEMINSLKMKIKTLEIEKDLK